MINSMSTKTTSSKIDVTNSIKVYVKYNVIFLLLGSKLPSSHPVFQMMFLCDVHKKYSLKLNFFVF